MNLIKKVVVSHLICDYEEQNQVKNNKILVKLLLMNSVSHQYVYFLWWKP